MSKENSKSTAKGKSRAPETKAAKAETKKKATEFNPRGATPMAEVTVRHNRSLQTRNGRGFSLSELARVGLAIPLARAHGLMVDDRRRSSLAPNIGKLGSWLEKPAPPDRVETPPPPKAEGSEKKGKPRARKSPKKTAAKKVA